MSSLSPRQDLEHTAMALDDTDMHRAGLAFMYRIVPVLVATMLYGAYSVNLEMCRADNILRNLYRLTL